MTNASKTVPALATYYAVFGSACMPVEAVSTHDAQARLTARGFGIADEIRTSREQAARPRF